MNTLTIIEDEKPTNEFYSFIVPVYNTENYVGRCLDSILNQTYKNFEVICVDDGSTDDSLSILKSYEEKDSRVKVFSQKNSGVSAARNLGLAESEGESISFVYIDIPMYYYYDRENSVVHTINQADVIDVIEKAYMKNIETYGDNKYLVLEQSFRTLLSARYLSSIDLAVDRCKRCNYLMDKLEIYRCSEIVWIKRLIYFLFRRFPWIFRLFRILSDPTMLKYEQDKKKQ